MKSISGKLSNWVSEQRAALKEHPEILDVFNDYLKRVGDPKPLDQGEVGAITFEAPKTAALCFDKVWGFEGDVPEFMRFGGVAVPEITIMSNVGAALKSVELYKKRETVGGDTSNLVDILRTVHRGLAGMVYGDPNHPPVPLEELASGIVRKLNDEFINEFGYRTVPVYGSYNSYDRDYKVGNYEVIVAALQEARVVDEQNLDWKQVKDFRADRSARQKFRRLSTWLDAEMVGKSKNYVVDTLNQRVADYEWAINTLISRIKCSVNGQLRLNPTCP